MRPRAGFKLIACENYGMFWMFSSIQANLGIFSFSEWNFDLQINVPASTCLDVDKIH